MRFHRIKLWILKHLTHCVQCGKTPYEIMVEHAIKHEVGFE